VKLTFTRDGNDISVEADDSQLVTAELLQGTDEDFIMLRYKPGALKPTLPEGSSKSTRTTL
jgi:hypothetical protein